jgi:hypothetical protein
MSRELISRHDAIGLLIDQGVNCIFTPVTGEERQVRAILTEGGSYQEGDKTLYRVETLKAFVLRDPSESLGGIDVAERGSALRIDGDPQDRVYSCTGDYDSTADKYSWTLDFVRRIPVEIGGNRRR